MRMPAGPNRRLPGLKERLDQAAARMNAFLLMIALGLAILDLTCFWALTIEKDLATNPQGTVATASDYAAPPSRN